MNRTVVKLSLSLLIIAATGRLATAQDGPYKVLSTTKFGGEGGFDYVTADLAERKLYVARSGPAGHVAVFSLDTLAAAGDISGASGHGAAIDTTYGHGFVTGKPATMFDTKMLPR